MLNIKLSEKILPNFSNFHRDYKNALHTFYVHKGGRGSAKSSHIAIEIILDIIKNPVSHLIVKRYSNSIELTVFEQIKWAINYLGVENQFQIWKKPFKIQYRARGNFIYFTGADDPEILKGLKSSEFPIACAWIEEITQFKSEDDLTSIINTVIREEHNEKYKICLSYNPPKRKTHWVNKKYESITLPDTYFVQHSTYLDNKYISKAFKDEAEHIKLTNERKYKHEYLGEAIGNGIVPFDNLTFRYITDDEIRNFDNIKQGIDWGYGIDPVHFTRLHYDKTRKKIYIFGEIHDIKVSNAELIKRIKNKRWDDFLIFADSAEPKSINNLCEEYIKCVGADKPPGSVEFGEKWLDEQNEIVIDHVRCPNTAREFENADYEVDKDGNSRNRLVDKDNHSIDAIRYALYRDILFGNKQGITKIKSR